MAIVRYENNQSTRLHHARKLRSNICSRENKNVCCCGPNQISPDDTPFETEGNLYILLIFKRILKALKRHLYLLKV